MTVILALKRLRQGDVKFKVSLGILVTYCLRSQRELRLQPGVQEVLGSTLNITKKPQKAHRKIPFAFTGHFSSGSRQKTKGMSKLENFYDLLPGAREEPRTQITESYWKCVWGCHQLDLKVGFLLLLFFFEVFALKHCQRTEKLRGENRDTQYFSGGSCWLTSSPPAYARSRAIIDGLLDSLL